MYLKALEILRYWKTHKFENRIFIKFNLINIQIAVKDIFTISYNYVKLYNNIPQILNLTLINTKLAISTRTIVSNIGITQEYRILFSI